jgi:hypothetical protein
MQSRLDPSTGTGGGGVGGGGGGLRSAFIWKLREALPNNYPVNKEGKGKP